MDTDPLPGIGDVRTAGNVTLHRIAAPLRRPFRTALRSVTDLDTVVVEVADGNGDRGWGEAAEVTAVTGQDQRRVAAMLLGPVAATLSDALLEDPEAASRTLGQVAAAVPAAANAVCAALLDLEARRHALPAHRLLGARTDHLTTTVTIARDAPSAMARDAAARAASGFTRLKLKLGGDDPRTDLDRIRAVADTTVGCRLLLDANQGWERVSADDCVAAILAEGLPVAALEQPLAASDLAGAVALRGRLAGTGIELVADESVFSLADARAVIDAGAADRINVKLAKAGGPVAARQILQLTRDRGIATMVGCMLESPLGVAAAAAVALAEGVTTCDLDAPLLLARSPVSGGPHLDGPRLTVSTDAGFGCTPPGY